MSWYEFLPKLLNMSMTASLIILAVLVVRMLLKKAPKAFPYALWGVVLFRLLCPVSVASDFSLLGVFQVPVAENGALEYIPENIVHAENPQVTLLGLGNWVGADVKLSDGQTAEGAKAEKEAGTMGAVSGEQLDVAQSDAQGSMAQTDVVHSGTAGETFQDGLDIVGEAESLTGEKKAGNAGSTGASLLKRLEAFINSHLPQGGEQLGADPLEAPITIATYIWGLGVIALILYNLVQLWRLHEKLRIAEPLKNNIYLADHIDTAFVMGLVRPKIYLPSGLKEQERGYIILHEQYHIRRGDHVVKVLAFVALCIHWFNPLVWVAFLLATKDMEMSCDEAVMKQMGQDIRAEYASSLLQFATGKRLIAGAPLAFGEGDTKARVKNVMHYKKPAFWMVLIAVVVCLVAVVCLVTNPKEENNQPLPLGKTFGCALRTYNGTGHYFNPEGELFFYITKDGHLMGKGMLHPSLETSGWVDLGHLEEVKLTAKNYDYYFQTGSPYEKYEIDKIMQGSTSQYRVQKAWQVLGAEEDLLAWNYYLLYLENGTWGMVCWDANGESGAVKWMVDLEEIEQKPVDVQVGMTYRTVDCRYMNPASSILAIGGDNGHLYRIEENAFVEVSKASGVETRIEIEQWAWQDFPYTDEEWAALFIPFTQGHENISQYYTEMLYQPLNNRRCLLKMDGQLWLVDITNGPKAEKYIWSIYSLEPVEGEGSSEVETQTGQDGLVVEGDENAAGQEGAVVIIPTVYDLTIGTTYRTSEYVSGSLWSYIIPFHGDSGYLYEVKDGELVIRNKSDGSEEHISVTEWGWQELPYTEEEWNAIAQSCSKLQDIRSTFEEVLYQPVSEDWFILRLDGVLLLVENMKWREYEEYLGDIFTLVPEGQKENTNFVKDAYEEYYEECPEGVYSAEEWLDEEGGLTIPFDWRDRLEMQMVEDRVGYYIPQEAMDRVSTAELLITLVDLSPASSYNVYDHFGQYMYLMSSKYNVVDELLGRPDLAEALFAEYQNDSFYLLRSFGDRKAQEAYDEEAEDQIDKIAVEEMLLASNLAFEQMDEAMKQEVLAQALQKLKQRQSGRLQCGYKLANGEIYLSEFPSGFFSFILEQKERSGSMWYQYLVETGETELVEKLDGLNYRQCWP